MKTSSINAICWLSSAALAGGLAFYLTGFFKRFKTLAPVDHAYARQVLDQDPVVVNQGRFILPYEQTVKPGFIQYNWTGKPPEKPKPEVVNSGPAPVVRTSVKDLLSIIYTLVDTDDPGGSRMLVWYGSALASHNDPTVGGALLQVGDSLPPPHDGIVLHSIRPAAVVFTFTEEGRENELIVPGLDDNAQPLITKVGPEGLVESVKPRIPSYRPKAADVPERTSQITNDLWQIGSEDADEFGRSYQRILTEDVKTRTRIDKNGRRSGVEITQVKGGSIAARHGAQEGDVIISINGTPISSEQEAIKFVKNNSENTSVWQVVVERFGRRETRVYKSPQ